MWRVQFFPMTDLKNETKLLVLKAHTLSDSDEEKLQNNLFVVKYESKTHKTQSASDIFMRAQCFVLDLTDSEQRVWYAHQRSIIKCIPNMRIVYVAKPGSKCDVKKTKEMFGAECVIKYLPEVAKTASEFIQKLLTDHIPQVQLGKLARVWSWLRKRVKCS